MLGGQIRQIRALDDLSPDTPLERRPTVIADLEESDEGVTLAFEGKRVLFPPQATDAVVSCFDAEGEFTAADLAGDLDEPSRLVLVRRLVREGFLRLSEPPSGDERARRSAADELP